MSREGRHSLLARQIRRHLGSEGAVPEAWRPFLDAVDDAYRQADDDRGMLERSMDLSSQELMQANAALRQSLSLLQATLESTADGILVVDLQGKIAVFNRRFAEMWRIPDEVLQSKNDGQALAFVLDQLVHPEDFLAKVRELYAQPDAESQDMLELKDGRVFERYSQPQRIGGESVGRVWSFRDVTEQRRAEEERARLQTMVAMGHLVGGLAHEVRNPLFAISATLEAVLSDLEGSDAPHLPGLLHLLGGLREPTARLSELMSELLEFGKPLSRVLTEGSLGEVVHQAVAENRPLAESKEVGLITRLTERGLTVGMNRRRLLIALSNLVQNAVHHTPKGGMVVVAAERMAEGDRTWVRCIFEDSGPGFRTEDLPRIFEPFFTRRRGGTGLGLSIVQRIAEEHRARILASNRPEGGAIVTLDFPPWCEGEAGSVRPPALISGPEATRSLPQ